MILGTSASHIKPVSFLENMLAKFLLMTGLFSSAFGTSIILCFIKIEHII